MILRPHPHLKPDEPGDNADGWDNTWVEIAKDRERMIADSIEAEPYFIQSLRNPGLRAPLIRFMRWWKTERNLSFFLRGDIFHASAVFFWVFEDAVDAAKVSTLIPKLGKSLATWLKPILAPIVAVLATIVRSLTLYSLPPPRTLSAGGQHVEFCPRP